ncbi:40-kDa huntingtin-associated protein [Eurosta solidaginis]|uniref:40-kDa huntingtin-associated protein n=1 Tax=Eurosta solidaginis TaxID=178769 RepID=UPI003530694E
MDNYPQKLVDQYLKASSKLKKFDRVVFKRFAPNVTEVVEDFARLATRFEEAGIFPYAAMCHLGVAKCELSAGNVVNECQAYLKAARAFMRAHNTNATLQLRSDGGECKEGALRCFCHALERCADDTVLKAAIIREMSPLQPYYDGCSSFASPTHRIYELELAAHAALEDNDFLCALQQLDDIVDSICERKQHELYTDLLRRVEILRLLLLMVLNLPPARQSPSHIKLIEYYERLADLEHDNITDMASPLAATAGNHYSTGTYVPLEMKWELAEIVLAWKECRTMDFKVMLEQFMAKFKILNQAHRHVGLCICDKIDEKY